MQKRKFSKESALMSTLIRISVISDQGTVFTNDKLEEAFGIFDYVVRRFTRFNESSDLAKLNAEHKGKPYVVDRELFDLVKFALDIAHKADGLFDPTIIDLLEAYGYGAGVDFNNLDNPDLMNEIRKVVLTRKNFRSVKLDQNNLTIQMAANQRLDLGGVGKGYAIDLAYNLLEKNFDSFIINAGGDIRAKGFKEDGNPWIVALEKEPLPNHPALSETQSWGNVNLVNQSLAASGSWARKIKFFHHLVNPITGWPVSATLQTFVIADTALEADAWATALFMLGIGGLDLIKKYGMQAMIVNNNGEPFQTEGFPLQI